MHASLRDYKARLGFLLRRNRYILGRYPARPALPGRVNVDYWQTYDGRPNLGDALSPVVVDWMLARAGMPPAAQIPVGRTAFLTAIGSVLHIGVNTTCVWGSGLLNPDPRWNLHPLVKRLDVRAVRGPLTRRHLQSLGYRVPQVYGDPAILMPLLYRPDGPAPRKDEVLVVNHFCTQAPGSKVDVLSADYAPFIDAVAGARMVVTSSLHGLILAECYGTPAVLFCDGRADWDLFKYRDWYESTGRPSFPVAASAEEAAQTPPAPLPDPGLLASLRRGLMEAFPYDLWPSPDTAEASRLSASDTPSSARQPR